jgi:hypothetical protein
LVAGIEAVNDFAPRSTLELLLSLERWELEQLGHKIHRLQHQDLAGSWYECSHAVCAQLRAWLELLSDDRDAQQPANALANHPTRQTIERIRIGYACAQLDVARAHELWNRSNALLHQASVARDASRQVRTRQRNR